MDICSNIPPTSAYEMYISQLRRFARVCSLLSSFYNVTVFWVLSCYFLEKRFILSFKLFFFPEDINTVENNILSYAYGWWQMVLAIRFWFWFDYINNFVSYVNTKFSNTFSACVTYIFGTVQTVTHVKME